MPLDLQQWANIAAIITAMAEVYRTGKEQFQTFYQQFRQDPRIDSYARVLSSAFSTYDEPEIDEIVSRINRCRERFISEGAGEARRRCFCSVLKDVKDGNGGTLPDIDEWRKVYRQLRCPDGTQREPKSLRVSR